jgi:hypothetical protein
MAFLKKAFAGIVHPSWGPQNWSNFVDQNRSKLANGPYRKASAGPNLVAQASEILGEQFDPNNYLLTHATIVASVDTDPVPNVKLGAIEEGGRRIQRKWAEYRVRPDCDPYINNNHDCWDRPVLLKSYRTFIGGHNFVEHVQIEEQSKGRIVDAVARDIGNSVYCDILIATHRKHSALIEDIKNDRMSTLSMGCSVTETICTKCGNVAADETEMCEHIKYAKGNYEYDAQGRKYRVAELCGHSSIDPTGGVGFIEASWVAVPAFQGAVKRNILEPEIISAATQEQARQVLASPPPEWTRHPQGALKAARFDTPTSWPAADLTKSAGPFDAPEDGGDEGGGEETEEKDPISELESEVEKYVLDKVKKKIKDKLTGDARDQASDGELATSTSDTVIHQGSKRIAHALASGTETLLRIARSDIELIDGIARLEASHGLKISKEVYRTVLRVGSTDGHASVEKYLTQCAEALNRQPTTGEATTLVRLGRILSLRKRTRS